MLKYDKKGVIPMAQKNYRVTKQYRNIKQSLLNELEMNGNTQDFFVSLVDDYLEMWVISRQLMDDIAENGVYIIYQNGKNQSGRTKNSSIQELTKVNAQMLKILQQLKIEAKTIDSLENDDDDEL